MPKLIYGVGLNDADYNVQKMSTVDGKIVRDWTCPYYQRWYDVLRRCYNKKALIKRPNYVNIEVCEEWLVFSNFRKWMINQDWVGKVLDKDLKVKGCTTYSPTTCMFISNQVNAFIREGHRSKNNLKVGVSWHKRDEKFTSQCYDTLQKKLVHLGYHDTEACAYTEYLKYKERLIHKLYKCNKVDYETYNLLLAWYNFHENHGRA